MSDDQCPHGSVITDGACYECCPFGDGSGDAPDCGHDDCPEHSAPKQPLPSAEADGNTVEHATDLAQAFVEVYEEASRIAALNGEFPRPSSLVLGPHHALYARLTRAEQPLESSDE